MVTTLSDYELKLVTDPGVLLTKNKIIQKVYEIFGGLCEDYKDLLQVINLIDENDIQAKISRGENYNGLPYVILDYPRQFGKMDVFAVRTFFWWGNFFSITLQLAGKYQHKYTDVIKKAIDKNLFEGWSIGCADDAWQHHFENDNYTQIQQGKNYDILNLPHLKIAKKIPLNQWDDVDDFFKKNFNFLMRVLAS